MSLLRHSLLKFFPVVFFVSLLLMFAPSNGYALTFADFAVFANDNVSAGNNSTVSDFNGGFNGPGVGGDGLVGANKNVGYGTGVDTGSVYAGKKVTGIGNNSVISGSVISNDGVVGFGTNVTVKGNVDVGGVTPGHFAPGNNGTVKGDTTVGGAIFTGSGVDLEGDVLANDHVTLASNGSAGDIGANGNVVIGSNTTVNSVKRTGLLVNNGTILNPPATVGPSVVNPETFAGIALPGASSFSASGAPLIKGSGQATTLAPGTYGHLILGNNNDLNLSSGTYFFGAITAGTGLDLNLDLTGGDLSIFILNNALFGNSFEGILSNGTEMNVFMEVHGLTQFGTNSEWYGTIYNPFGNLNFGNNSDIWGALYSGKSIDLGTGVHVRHKGANQLQVPGTNPVVPEPGTAFLFLSGLLLPAIRRFRLS